MQNYAVSSPQTLDRVRTFIARTYSWMAAGLALTAGVAYVTAANEPLALQVMSLRMPLLFAQLAVVFVLGFMAQRLSSTVAGLLFMGYAALTGLTFSALLLAYSPTAIFTAFGSTALTFGVMSAFGFMTKRDLSGMGRFLMFALIGLIIAMIINIFIGGSTMSLIISAVGVVLFAGLTAYDTQMLRNLALSGIQGEQAERASINGALSLYLNFINIFLMLLNLQNRD